MAPPDDHELRIRELELAEARREARDQKLDEIHNAICGEGEDPGLVVRVDRIEQRHSFFEKLVTGALGVLTVVGTFLGIKSSG